RRGRGTVARVDQDAVGAWRPQRTATESIALPLPAGPSHLTVTWRVPASGKPIVPRYRPGPSGVIVAPAIIGAIPGIAMLVLRVTFPTSTGCFVGAAVNSTVKVFDPGLHRPVSLDSATVISFVFAVALTLGSA